MDESERLRIAGESAVEVITWCLNTSEDEHLMEMEEENWVCELGEDVAGHMATSSYSWATEFFLTSLQYWYLKDPLLRLEIEMSGLWDE